MTYGLMVAAVMAGFGLTAFCAAIFRITAFWALIGLLATFSFCVPALLGVWMSQPGESALPLLATSFGLAAAIVAIVITARSCHLYLSRRRGRGPADRGDPSRRSRPPAPTA